MSQRHDFENNYAIIIGINNYAERPLRAARNDAKKLDEILRSENRKKDEQYKTLLLTDEDATYTQLTVLLENLKSGKLHLPDKTVELKENNRLLIYFSGHGVASNLENSQKIRNEAERDEILQKQFLVCQDGKKLPLKYLFDNIKDLDCRHLLLILDCCFAGQAISNTVPDELMVFRTASFEDDSIIKYERQYELMSKKPAWTAITSSSYEEALDSKNDNQIHSYFAQALFKALDCKTETKSDSNRDGIITDNELFTYLKNDTFLNKYQTPQKFSLTFTGKKQSGQYFFLLPNFEPINLKEIEDIDSPYKGLFSYEKKDALIFKGRNRLIEELFNRVCKENNQLTVVTGASGSGKSSLVKAGLVKKIEKENDSAQSSNYNQKLWKIFEPIRPGEFPFRVLVKEFESLQGFSLSLELFYDKLNQNSMTRKGFTVPIKSSSKNKNLQKEIEAAFNELSNKLIQQIPNDQKLLLIIDQFEELVTLCQPLERDYFLKLLVEILNKSKNLKLVLTVRSDFEIYFRGTSTTTNSSDITDKNINQYWNKEARLVVDEMKIDELKEAIEKPARLFGVDFESDKLVNDIIEDVRGMPGALALLSFTLEELYLKAKGDLPQNFREPITITEDHYKKLNGVVNALTNKATKTYEKLHKEFKLSEEDKPFTKEYEEQCEKQAKPIPTEEDQTAGEVRQAMMKQLMLRMVTTQAGKLAKRPVPKSELEYPDWHSRYKDATYRMCQVIDQLIKERLIVSNLYEYEKHGKKVEICYVEPAHDALILYWDKLHKKSKDEQEEESENPVQEQGWLEQQEENLAIRDRLIPAVQDWQERQQEQKTTQFSFLKKFKYQTQIISLYKKLIRFCITIINLIVEIELKEAFIKKGVQFIFRLIFRLARIVLGLILIIYGIAIIFVVFELYIKISPILLPVGLGLIWLGLFSFSRRLASKLSLGSIIRLIRRFSKKTKNSNNYIGTNNSQLKQSSNLSIEVNKSNINHATQGNYLWEKDARLEQVRKLLYVQDSWLNKTETEFVRESTLRKRKGEIKLLFGATFLLGVAAILTGFAWRGQKEASIEKVNALRQSAEVNLQSGNDLDAAVDILRAQKTLESFSFTWGKPVTEWTEVQGTLHRVFYAARESNRLQNRGRVYDIALSSDGTLLATVGKKDTITIYQVPSKKYDVLNPINLLSFLQLDRIEEDKPTQLQEFSTGQDNVLHVALFTSQNDTWRIATGAKDGTVKLWKFNKDNKDNKEEEPLNVPPISQNKPPVSSIAFDLKGEKLAIGREDGTIDLWNINDDNKLEKFSSSSSSSEKKNPIYSLAFSNDEKLVSVLKTKIEIWDTKNKTLKQITDSKDFDQKSSTFYRVAFTHDNRLATGDKDGVVQLWQIQDINGKIKVTKDNDNITTKKGSIYGIAFSDDGKLATLEADDKVIFWDTSPFDQNILQSIRQNIPFFNQSKRFPLNQLYQIQPQEQSIPIHCAAYSLDGKTLATGDDRGTIRVWDASGKLISRFSTSTSTQQQGILSIALNRKGKKLAIVGKDEKVTLWDITNLRMPTHLEGNINKQGVAFKSVAFTPDDRLATGADAQLATGGTNGTIQLWKIIDNKPLQKDQLIQTESKEVNAIIFFQIEKDNPELLRMATLGEDSTVKLYHVTSNKTTKPLDIEKQFLKNVSSIAFSPKGELALGKQDGTVEFWDFSKPQEPKPLPLHYLPTQQGKIQDLAFSSENKLATVGEDGTIKLWKTSINPPSQFPISQQHIAVTNLVFLSDDQDKADQIAIIGENGLAKIATIKDETIKSLSDFPQNNTQQNDQNTSQTSLSRNVVLSPNGKRYATFENNKTIRLWDRSKNNPFAPISTEANQESSVIFSPNGEHLATFEDDNTVKLWDISHGKPEPLYSNLTEKNKKNDERIKSTYVAFSPNGELLATIDNNNSNKVNLWKISGHTLEPSSPIITEQDKVTSIAFSPDGNLLATGAEDGTIRLGDTKGALHDQINALQGSVKSIVFSPDSNLLATIGKKENTLKVWYTLNNRLRPFKAERREISSVAFSPDGTKLATAGNDGLINLWQLGGNNKNDQLFGGVCNLVKDYLDNSPDLELNDRKLCDDIIQKDQSNNNNDNQARTFTNSNQSTNQLTENEAFTTNRTSIGNKILVSTLQNSSKQLAVQAFAAGDFKTAVNNLEISRKTNPNDPEALIYLNNARASTLKSYIIAAPVPILSNPSGALEILRGVAQAQDEINKAGGINGIPLRVLIADDEGKPEVAEKIAQQLLTQEPNLLGVVGHYASDIALKAGEIYNQQRLPVILPVSTSVKLSEFGGKYTFRTVPNDKQAAEKLADYMIKPDKLNKKKAAVFFNSQSNYSRSLESAFKDAVSLQQGQVVSIDLSKYNFSNKVNQAQEIIDSIKKKVDVLVLMPDYKQLQNALEIIKANKKSLPVLAGDDVYSPKTLKDGQKNIEGMIVAIPWHIDLKHEQPFVKASINLWGKRDVNWRTAMSYDATQALIAAIKQKPTREGVAQVLRSNNLQMNNWATGKVSFSPSGDRNEANIQLVKVEPGTRSGYGHDFVPVQKP